MSAQEILKTAKRVKAEFKKIGMYWSLEQCIESVIEREGSELTVEQCLAK
jgi:hypothetical protein